MKKLFFALTLALVLLTLAACGNASPAAQNTPSSTEPPQSASPTEEPAPIVEPEEKSEYVDPSTRSDELYEARLDAQHYMLDVTHSWEEKCFFYESKEAFVAAYKEHVDELYARCEESKAIIESMSDPDSIKQYYKDDLEKERDQYLIALQGDYDRASEIYE